MRLPDHPDLPEAVTESIRRLQRKGHSVWLAGEGLACAWWADSPSRPASWLALCSASAEQVLDLEPHAVPTSTRTSVVTLPTAAGPLDLRCDWGAAEHDPVAGLAGFGFSIYAIAYDPVAQQWIDPFDVRGDLEARRLTCVGIASEVFERDAIAPLRALRLVSEAGMTADAELEAELGKTKIAFTLAMRRHGRSELARMLLGQNAGAALALAERTGMARTLAPCRPGASAWIDALPRVLELRLAGWLARDAAAWLRDWRFGIERSRHVLEWLALHPIEQAVDPRRDAAVGKLERRVDAEGLRALFRLREAELASGSLSADEVARSRKALAALEQGLERVRANRESAARRKTLAIDGTAVMDLLACRPGREVGLALRHVSAWVAEDESRNELEKLKVELKQWASNHLK